ncbi:MAG: superoxide dismutase [Candidatus Egerieousia sp.]
MKTFDELLNKKDESGNFILSELSYANYALEPLISERTLNFHYGKHLQAYISKVNELKKDFPADVTIEDLIKASGDNKALFNNASQVYNHYFYFEQFDLKGEHKPTGRIAKLIDERFGNFDAFKKELVDAGLKVFGSGWVYLSESSDGKLIMESFSGAGTPLDKKPLLTLDVWEHAYYLDTQNDRKKYIENFLEAVDWNIIEKRLNG